MKNLLAFTRAPMIVQGLLLLGLSSQLFAMQTPIGLDWRKNVFVQEYWQQGKPHYCVTNLRENNVQLQVARWVSRKDSTIPLTEWQVEAGAFRCFEAEAFVGIQYLEFQILDGPRLGLLTAPNPAISRGDSTRAAVASYRGLNGSCYNLGMWLEQEGMSFRSGERVALTLFTPARKGTIFIQTGTNSKYAPRIVPDKYYSASLPIEAQQEGLLIDTNRPSDERPVHSVKFSFTAPIVKKTTLLQFSAQIQVTGENQGCLVRGVTITRD